MRIVGLGRNAKGQCNECDQVQVAGEHLQSVTEILIGGKACTSPERGKPDCRQDWSQAWGHDEWVARRHSMCECYAPPGVGKARMSLLYAGDGILSDPVPRRIEVSPSIYVHRYPHPRILALHFLPGPTTGGGLIRLDGSGFGSDSALMFAGLTDRRVQVRVGQTLAKDAAWTSDSSLHVTGIESL